MGNCLWWLCSRKYSGAQYRDEDNLNYSFLVTLTVGYVVLHVNASETMQMSCGDAGRLFTGLASHEIHTARPVSGRDMLANVISITTVADLW